MKTSNKVLKVWKVLLVIAAPLVFLILAWKWVLTPTINPNPKDVLTISGTFPFDKGYELILSQQAYTTNPIINFVCGGFGAVRGIQGISCRSEMELIKAKRIGCCNYEVVLYRDRYLHGIAGWAQRGFAYRAYPRATQTLDGLYGGMDARASEMKCLDSAEQINRLAGLFCIATNNSGPSIYDKETHRLELNFRLASAIQSSKGKGSKP